MARTRSSAAATVADATPMPTTSLVASSVRYSGKAARVYRPTSAWQREAYRHYGICGEARFAAQFFANSLSRATLYAAVENEKGVLERQTSGLAHEELRRIFGPDTATQMLAAIGLHLTIAGEAYIVGREHRVADFDANTESKGEVWEVVSTLEMEQNGEQWSINYNNGRAPIPLTDSDIVIRIWRSHPEKRIEADSPFRSLLPILTEIEWLTRHIFAQTQSRLVNAGILFLPQGMTFPPPPANGESEQEAIANSNEATTFMLTLADTMSAIQRDPGSPASQVPIVVTAPDDVIDKARLMTFWSEMDDKALEMRNSAIHRFALGMDLPAEQVEGMSSNSGSGGGTSNGISHWGQWQIDEATTKLHIEPMLELICAAVTVSFLRAATDGNELVRYDTTALRLRPDRSKESLELWDRGLIKGEVVVRENGFAAEDMMDEDERKMWLLIKIASGSATPEQVQGALGVLGVDLPALEQPEAEVRETRPAPSLDDHEQRTEPDLAASVLLAVCEPLVLRGLERAGNRLRTACKGSAPDVPTFETHVHVPVKDPTVVLDDAWATAGIVLAGRADPGQIVPMLDSYCRMLFATQQAHSRARLSRWLEATAVAA